jgi:hypothetical protein
VNSSDEASRFYEHIGFTRPTSCFQREGPRRPPDSWSRRS